MIKLPVEVNSMICLLNFLKKSLLLDINECLQPNPPCPSDQSCINNNGSFMCICPEGIVMNDHGMCVPGIEKDACT